MALNVDGIPESQIWSDGGNIDELLTVIKKSVISGESGGRGDFHSPANLTAVVERAWPTIQVGGCPAEVIDGVVLGPRDGQQGCR